MDGVGELVRTIPEMEQIDDSGCSDTAKLELNLWEDDRNNSTTVGNVQ
jgi:hypothetical protein